MKIIIKRPKKITLRIWLPNFILRSKFAKRMIKNKTNLSIEQIDCLLQELKKNKTRFSPLLILDVTTKDEERVKIFL